MLTEYLQAAMRHAHYERLEDDQAYYGEIPECRGVYAHAETLEECREGPWGQANCGVPTGPIQIA